MLPLMSIAAVASSGMFSDAKCAIVCGTPSSYTWNASRGRFRTNRPCPSVTTVITCTASTSTTSARSSDLVPTLSVTRPSGRVATTRITCASTR